MQKYIYITLLLLSTLSYSQIKLSGIVRDSIGNPLESANVIAMNTTNTLEGYAITDAKGFYKIQIAKPSTIKLKVSYLGFDSQTKVLVIADEETTKDFVLIETDSDLDTVEITYEMPVTIKGDTIVYNADAFTSGREKKLGDVLKKLPGVEVNSKGEIEIEGKKVSKVMVEGKDFFDGDSKLATKNIPADAIKKIEVLKNYNDISQMKDLKDDSNSIAINIKLKEGKKNFWFGEVTAGVGEGDQKTRYVTHPKLFFYSPRKSINVITDLNNIGEIPFSFQDYFKFSGGFKNMMRSGGVSLSSNSLGLSFLKDNKAKALKNKFGAFNFSQALNKHLDFNGFAIYSKSENDLQTNRFTTIFETNINEKTASKTHQNNTLGLLKLSLAYKPNSHFQMDYDVLVKTSDVLETKTVNSSLEGLIKTRKEDRPFSLNQNMQMYYTLNDNNIFSLSAQYLFDQSKPYFNSISNRVSFPNFDTGELNYFNISQTRAITTNQCKETLDYYYILDKKSNINISIGHVSNNQYFQSHIYRDSLNNTRTDFKNPSLNNDVAFNFFDVFIGVHYKLKTGVFTLTPGISAHQYLSKTNQLGVSTKKTPFYWLPDFTAKIALKRSESIQLNYTISTDFSDISKLAEGILFNSYKSLSYGNRYLKNALYHNYRISYFNFNTFNFTNIHGNISYTKRNNSVKPLFSLPTVINRQYTYLNTPEIEDDLTSQWQISKRFGYWKAIVFGNWSQSHLNTLRTSGSTIVSKKNKSKTQNYKASIATNFKSWPNFELGYKKTLTRQNDFTTNNHKIFSDVEISFLKHFIVTSNYNYNQFTDSQHNTNSYSFLNTDLYYQKEGSQWEFKASVINMLDTKSIRNDYFSEEYVSNLQYVVQPRYVLFSVKYDL